MIPLHCVANIGPQQQHQQLKINDDADQMVQVQSSAGGSAAENAVAALLRQRSRTAGSYPLSAVLLTHLREARLPWRHNQDRAYASCQLSFSDDSESLMLEVYANGVDSEWRWEEGLSAVGFVPRTLFNLCTTRVAACRSVWSEDRRLGGLVRYCQLGGRSLLVRNAATGQLAVLDAESERVAVIRVLDRMESNTFSCILKLNRQVTVVVGFSQGCRSRPFLKFPTPAPDKFRLRLLLLLLLLLLLPLPIVIVIGIVTVIVIVIVVIVIVKS